MIASQRMRTLTFKYVIGAGAMGTVYHAELRVPHGGFTKQCAVKVIQSSAADQVHFRSRMRDEARLLGMLQDEQILGVTELATVEGRDAVIMEYVDGVDLNDLIRSQECPARALAELGAELAGILYRAHSAKHPNTQEPLCVIHRDVKPANVMITARGGVRLLDFGVARAAFDSRESQTQGLVLGTLNYFPPEILAGGDPTPAVDIYGLGLTLWECAAGRNWGSPQVNQKRFEHRVDQRLAEIEGKYKAIIPVLHQMLQWHPKLRADGGVLERSLLQSADSSQGKGLRTWAREVVPPMLQARGRKMDDPLVGRTIPIDGGGDAGGAVEPLRVMEPPTLELKGDSESSFNDLAPPAAVKRAMADPTLDEMIVVPPSRPKKKKRGPSAILILGGAVVVGALVGLFIVLIMVVVAVIVGMT
ncbi:MAG: serine/threonine protein kinase [Proteobacteria bacterium]|nr:serine/threonine protein kinase [Pseudomonadota bacterium]